MNALVLGRYDASAVRAMLEEEGVLERIASRGFGSLEVTVDGGSTGLTHVRLFGSKEGGRHELLDACLSEARIPAAMFAGAGYGMDRAIDLLTVFWLREQDPTRSFSPSRPPLPLQQNPGLGVLARAFLVARRMACEMGKDGLGCFPKYFHDALIFQRSRLLLFLDGAEQGRFLALARELEGLGLREATLALIEDRVFDVDGNPVRWLPGFQVLPLSPLLASYFHSEEYSHAAERAYAAACYHVVPRASGAEAALL